MKYLSTARSWTLLLASLASFPLLTPAQSPGSSSTPATSLKVPVDTTFLAALATPMRIGQMNNGDPVEAQTIQDVKQGHDVLLKKGSALLGHVESVRNPERAVVVVFDRARPKNGEETQLHLVIQALAPLSDVQTDNVDFSSGRGMQGATQEALPAGHASATRGSVNPLTTTSHGVQDLPGLDLRERIDDGRHSTVLAATRKDVQLKKGTQLVMKVVSQ